MNTAKAIIQQNQDKLDKAKATHILKWTIKQYHNGNTVSCSAMTNAKRYDTFIKANGQAYCSCPAFQYKKDAKACKHILALALVVEHQKKPTGF